MKQVAEEDSKNNITALMLNALSHRKFCRTIAASLRFRNEVIKLAEFVDFTIN